MDQLVDGRGARGARREDRARRRERCARSRRRATTARRPTDDSVRSRRAHRHARSPTPPCWGVREVEVDLDEVYPHLDTHVLFKLHWGGRGVKGEAWRRARRASDFQPRLERMWREQDYLHPRALLGYFPCYSEGNEHRRARPRGPRDASSTGSSSRASRKARPHLPRRLLPPAGQRRARRRRAPGRHGRRRGHRADGAARARRRVRRAALRPRPRRADRRGHGRVAALRRSAATSASRSTQGRRYSWGYPACPDQSEHEKVFALLDARADRPAPVRRLRRRARAVDASRSSPTTRRRSTSA